MTNESLIHREKKSVKAWKTTAVLFLVILLAAAVFLLCYHYDNKYTAKGPQPIAGVLMLDEQALEEYPVIYLIHNWEIYYGKLLAPENFSTEQVHAPFPDEHVFIGQYGSFDGNKSGNARSPHGSVTYRLNIALPTETKSYTLELPEIYSAYQLYINGAPMAQMGDPNPESYRPETGNRSVTVQAAERMEILIAVSDYSRFYSGMVYPPAFGKPDAVQSHILIRYGLRTAVSAIALLVGLLYFCIWLFTEKNEENHLMLLYSALCICFVLYTCYPVVKTVFAGGMGFYTIENFAYCAMFLLVMVIGRRITDTSEVWWNPFKAFGIFVCCCALFLPLFLGDSLMLILAYSKLIGIYPWVSAAFLTISAGCGIWRSKIYAKTILVGILVFDTALVMDRLFPMFEPIRFGWFTELAGGFLVLAIGLVMALEVVRQFRQRQAMELEITKSRMDIMLSQIQPHFLYNSLTAIGKLCDIDPKKAKSAVIDFADYLRGNLESLGKGKLIFFEDELEHVEAYLALEQLRYKERLQVVYEISQKDFILPPLTVQPLVENAVQHGLMERAAGGILTIRTEMVNHTVRITIIDDGVGFDPTVPKNDGRTHVGIENVQGRLFAMCGGSLEIESAPGLGTTAVIIIPCTTEEEKS